jgi:polyhydroxyalkanoate synthesis repressor PhaR
MTEQPGAAPSAGPAPVVLKKYGNRRLYDTNDSRYVTLVEVEGMVQRGVDIVVLDAKTGADITKEILVQLLLERDEARAALPVGLLKQAVRLAGTPLKDNLARMLQEGLDAFLGSQRAMLDAQRAFTAQLAQQQLPSSPTSGMTSGITSAMTGLPWAAGVPTLWNPFSALTAPPPRPGDAAPANQPPSPSSQAQQTTASPPAPAQQWDVLKAELSETQALVKRLLEREQAAGAPRAPRAPERRTKKRTPTKPKKPRGR